MLGRIRILIITFAIVFILCFSAIAPASALIRQAEEISGQMLSQSRQTLEDKAGNTWQVIFFKEIKTGETPIINLRLVGFPGAIAFAHPQDLKIKIRPEMTLTAQDIFTQQSPSPNVGQYDFSEIVERLESNSFWEIELPLVDKTIELRIPYFVIEEWQTVAATK
ncbi:MAG: DUF3122 domain-containing protein [Hydrococcus sp. Prado102]|jgi:hypothetical protein|nr:DUF3122 domain-containing protein [Hydrococcus sp. Prado102]